jgi:hypothetical protein
MLYISTATPLATPNDDNKRQLARLRPAAKRRGLRIPKDWTGAWSLVDTKIPPLQALVGLFHVSLGQIEAELSAPLPPPEVRTSKPNPAAVANGSSQIEQLFQKLRTAGDAP